MCYCVNPVVNFELAWGTAGNKKRAGVRTPAARNGLLDLFCEDFFKWTEDEDIGGIAALMGVGD